ncbi:hypothetical protein OIU76_023222 [Salix suchowensis]|nr:hypothetical protein OIU76_023222 [Salix suchowensis]
MRMMKPRRNLLRSTILFALRNFQVRMRMRRYRANEDSFSSESESNVHYHKDANSVVKHAVKPSVQPAVKSSEQPAETLDEQITGPNWLPRLHSVPACPQLWSLRTHPPALSHQVSPKLKFYAELSDADACTLLVDDLDVKCAMWKTCLIGYVSGKFPGYKALSAAIDNEFNCEAVLTLHESGWLIYKFKNEDDKLAILRGGPYLVFGRPLMLREMPEFFNFNSSEMSTLPCGSNCRISL